MSQVVVAEERLSVLNCRLGSCNPHTMLSNEKIREILELDKYEAGGINEDNTSTCDTNINEWKVCVC